MSHVTEAAGLIGSGAAYGRRLGLRSPSGETVFAGVKPGAFSLYFDDAPFYHVDLEGRWQRALIAGVHYLKGLDGAVAAIDRVREGENLVLRRRAVPFAEASDLDDRVRGTALDLIESIRAGHWTPVEPPPKARPLPIGDLLAILDRIGTWDAAAWFRHRERYLATYGPLPFLPPEARQAVVLQATLGHASGVAFGGGEAAEPYTRNPEEFRAHVRDVADLFGRRASQCRVAFLAGADTLHLPADDVAALLDAIRNAFPIGRDGPFSRLADWDETEHRLTGTIAVLDDLTPPLPDLAAWRRYGEAGLSRVVLGVESGDRTIRGLHGRAWDDEALPAVVADLKAAGIAVSVMVLAGAGGIEDAQRHVAATVASIAGLDLGPGDFVYLLDADEVGGRASRERLLAAGRTPLDAAAIAAQQAELKGRLADRLAPKRARALPYSLGKQWA